MNRKEILLKRNKIKRNIDEMKNYQFSKENDMSKVTSEIQKARFKYNFYNELIKLKK